MDITQAPSGINLVVETDAGIYIGRLGRVDGSKVQLRHAVVFPMTDQNSEKLIRETARWGVPVAHEELLFEVNGIRRVRKLGDVPKA